MNHPRRPTVQVIYSDSSITAIDKPSGITSVSERWDSEAATAIDLLWSIWKGESADAPRPHVIHRLDKDTSGILLFARHRDAQVSLREQFRLRTVEKTYYALTAGVPTPSEGSIELKIEEDPAKAGRVRKVRSGQGKKCFTDYRVLEVHGWYAWVEVRPHTGRTHQIRISLRELGAPCVADPFYGDGSPLLLSKLKRDYKAGRGREERPLLGRLGLHAARLSFEHPESGERLSLEAPLPKDIRTTLRQLSRWA